MQREHKSYQERGGGQIISYYLVKKKKVTI